MRAAFLYNIKERWLGDDFYEIPCLRVRRDRDGRKIARGRADALRAAYGSGIGDDVRGARKSVFGEVFPRGRQGGGARFVVADMRRGASFGKCGTPKITMRGGVCEAEITSRGDVTLTIPEVDIGKIKLRRADVSPPTEYAKLDFFGARAFCPTDDVWDAILFGLGEKMSTYRAFSSGADVDIVRLRGSDTIEVRSYERGAGYITSAGGAVVAAMALHALGKCGTGISVAVDSGRMNVSIGKKTTVTATVTKVFKGEL